MRRLVIDINLSPRLVPLLAERGLGAVHWSNIGSPMARDEEILDWARRTEAIVLTHDLDFGSILAATAGDAPSVIQVRTEDVAPDVIIEDLVRILHHYEAELDRGALVTLRKNQGRVRILPIGPPAVEGYE